MLTIPATPVISVLGARGGVGTSTLAVALTQVAALQHNRVALIDGAPRNGLEVLMDADGPAWQDLDRFHASGNATIPTRYLNAATLVVGWQQLSEISIPTATWAVEAIRTTHDLVIVDAGTFSTPMEQHLVQGSGAIVLLVPGELRALTYAVHLVPTLHAIAPVHLVVAKPSPSGMSDAEIAELLNLPLATTVQRESRLPVRGEHAQLPTRRLCASAEAVLSVLGLW